MVTDKIDCVPIFFTVIVGEIANFAAYAFAPAILVTPLGALSIIFRYLYPLCLISLSLYLCETTKVS